MDLGVYQCSAAPAVVYLFVCALKLNEIFRSALDACPDICLPVFFLKVSKIFP